MSFVPVASVPVVSVSDNAIHESESERSGTGDTDVVFVGFGILYSLFVGARFTAIFICGLPMNDECDINCGFTAS